jgi:hypothetical protein
MEFVPVLVMSSAVKKLVDFVKYATNADINALVTQLTAWLSGIAVSFVAGNSDWAQGVEINGALLGELNGWSKVLVGFALASTAGVGWDTIKALDSSNSAITPNIMRPGAPPPVN